MKRMRSGGLVKVAAVLAVMLAVAVVYVYGVYHGYFQLNHPSRTRYPIRGVDISHYQGEIDWQKLSEQGIEFAYIKATEGSSHVDERFEYNWQQSEKVQLNTGAYHFFSFYSPGEQQAANFIRTVGDRESMLPPVVDVEYYADKKVNQPEVEVVRRQLENYINVVKEYYGQVPVIYSTEDVWEKYIKGYFEEEPLWIRNVISEPVKDADWTFWQYSNRTRLEGYSGEEEFIDMNVFCGDKDDWETWKNQ